MRLLLNALVATALAWPQRQGPHPFDGMVRPSERPSPWWQESSYLTHHHHRHRLCRNTWCTQNQCGTDWCTSAEVLSVAAEIKSNGMLDHGYDHINRKSPPY